jgi:hypothetical protein
MNACVALEFHSKVELSFEDCELVFHWDGEWCQFPVLGEVVEWDSETAIQPDLPDHGVWELRQTVTKFGYDV